MSRKFDSGWIKKIIKISNNDSNFSMISFTYGDFGYSGDFGWFRSLWANNTSPTPRFYFNHVLVSQYNYPKSSGVCGITSDTTETVVPLNHRNHHKSTEVTIVVRNRYITVSNNDLLPRSVLVILSDFGDLWYFIFQTSFFDKFGRRTALSGFNTSQNHE